MVGTTISHYKILEKIGEGGMGVVYKAHDTDLDRFVALKFLPNYLTSDATEKERFYHEARAASALNHANICTVFEIKEQDPSKEQSSSQLFLAMEFVEGKTLKGLVSQEPIPLRKVLDLAIQICDGLAAAHEKGVVHRDIKSDNIMVTPKGQVKIMDFGLAKVKGSTKLTKAGSTLGTAAYMSPEQAQGEDVDHRSDIFSFGVVLYELLTGRLPFRGEHHAALMYSLVNEEPLPVARFNDKATAELERIVSKALAKDRDERYQHVDEMLADLRRERKHLEYARAGYATATTVASSPSIPIASPKKRNPMKILIPAVIGVAAVIGIVVFNPFNFQISTQKSAAETGKSTLAVMYFENIPDPEDKDHTGEMLTNLITTALFQTKDMEVISRERLYDLQKELGQGDSRTITPSMASRVAQRAGVTMMLLGSILQKQPSLAVTYRLVEVQTGKIISTQRVSDYPTDKVFALADTLALMVKNDLHFKQTPAGVQSVTSVTTSSPEAYRSYLEGVELCDKFYTKEAKAALLRAIELDSNFAMAYFKLANVPLLNDDELTEKSLRKAYSLSDRATECERLQIQASYFGTVQEDIKKATSLMEEMVQKYPHQEGAYETLGGVYFIMDEFDKAAATCERGLQLDSLNKNLWNYIAYFRISQGQKSAALNAIERYIAIAPAEPNPYDSKGDIYGSFGDYDSAAIWWNKALAFRSDFTSLQKLADLAVAREDYVAADRLFRQLAAGKGDEGRFWVEGIPSLIDFRKGKLNQAQKEFETLLEHCRSQGMQSWVGELLADMVVMSYEKRDFASMARFAEAASDEYHKQSSNTLYFRATLLIAEFLNGKEDKSRKIIDDLKQTKLQYLPVTKAKIAYAEGIVLFEQGKYTEAGAKFDEAMKQVAPHHAPMYHRAVCLLKLGRTEEAIDELQRLASFSPIGNDNFDYTSFPFGNYSIIGGLKAHYFLGLAYELKGDNGKAIEEYRKFVEAWKEADFKSPELSDARSRLVKLTGTAQN